MNHESIFDKTINTPIPEHLYHYTSSKGLHGIFTEKALWLTKINYLNDTSELNLTIKYFRQELKLRLDNGDTIRLEGELKSMLNKLDRVTSFGINLAVSSFTTLEDHLSQWRGYCKIGDGYCVGFYAEKLKEQISGQGYLVKCTYNKDEHKSMVNEVINYCDLKQDSLAYPAVPSIKKMSFEAAVLFIAPMIKDEGFFQEEEWRIIMFGEKSTAKLRSGNFSLIPYWTLELPNLDKTLYKIVIGPTPRAELSKEAVRILVRSNLFVHFHANSENQVINSNIPYSTV